MVNLMFYYLCRNLDSESIEKLRQELENAALIVRHPLLQEEAPKRRLRAVPDAPEPSMVERKGRWQPPPGWKPPGWNEERSYANAKSFIGFQQEIKP